MGGYRGRSYAGKSSPGPVEFPCEIFNPADGSRESVRVRKLLVSGEERMEAVDGSGRQFIRSLHGLHLEEVEPIVVDPTDDEGQLVNEWPAEGGE